MASLLQSYLAWGADMEERLLLFVDPTERFRLHPKGDLPLANFSCVYAICVAYLLFVVIGTVRCSVRKTSRGME